MKKITIKRALIILALVAVILTVVTIIFISGQKGPVYTTATAEYGKILQTVSETGTVRSANELNLSFLNTGKIAKINILLGDKVEKDTVIAELDYTSQSLAKVEAEANLKVAQETLNKLIAGASAADISVARANVQQAQSLYDSAVKESDKTKQTVNESITQAQKRYNDLINKGPADITTYEQAVITAENNFNNTKKTYQSAIDNARDSALTALEDKISKANGALDTINRTMNDEDAKNTLSINNKQYISLTLNSAAEAKTTLLAAINDLNRAKSDDRQDLATDALGRGLTALNKTFAALDNCYKALENSAISSAFTQTELDALKTGISGQQTVVGAAISLLQTAKQSYDSAILSYNTNVSSAQESLNQARVAYDNAVTEAGNNLNNSKLSGDQQVTAADSRVSSAMKSLQVAQAQLNKTMAKPEAYDISLTQARVNQAQAALDSTLRQIENSVIRAPISGTVTKSNFLIGEQVSPAQTAFAMIGENNFEIEVLISEADISKINLKAKAEITLDAFGDDLKFKGEVVFIEPAETIIQDVIYYKVKVNFDPAGQAVKSGMTANIIIIAAEKENALVIPVRAVIQKNGQGKFVRLLSGNEVKEVPVVLGLSGDEGMIEVTSGLSQGDVVVTSIKESK